LHPGKYITPGLNALGGDFRLGRNLDRRSRFFIRPARREVLDPGHEISALLLGEGAPLRHVRAVETASDGVEKILVGRQGSGRSGAALEYAQLEVAGLGVNPGEAFAISVAQFAMATDTVAAIVRLGVLGMAGNISDVAFHAHARFQVVLRELRPGRHRERQNSSYAQ